MVYDYEGRGGIHNRYGRMEHGRWVTSDWSLIETLQKWFSVFVIPNAGEAVGAAEAAEAIAGSEIGGLSDTPLEMTDMFGESYTASPENSVIDVHNDALNLEAVTGPRTSTPVKAGRPGRPLLGQREPVQEMELHDFHNRSGVEIMNRPQTDNLFYVAKNWRVVVGRGGRPQVRQTWGIREVSGIEEPVSAETSFASRSSRGSRVEPEGEYVPRVRARRGARDPMNETPRGDSELFRNRIWRVRFNEREGFQITNRGRPVRFQNGKPQVHISDEVGWHDVPIPKGILAMYNRYTKHKHWEGQTSGHPPPGPPPKPVRPSKRRRVEEEYVYKETGKTGKVVKRKKKCVKKRGKRCVKYEI